MKVFASTGREDVAVVYLAEMSRSCKIEFVESLEPPIPREKKWVLIVSTLFGCPVGCLMCDAGNYYKGKLTSKEIFSQIDFLVSKRYPNKCVPVEKFKIQFARMGEPSLNPHVLDVLQELPERYNAPGLMPALSTIAPAGTDDFFDQLKKIKKSLYTNGNFQLQFSVHTTDKKIRDRLIPMHKWDMTSIADYGERFLDTGDRKITLNFALAKGVPVSPSVLADIFSPELFLIKFTPVNPTYRAVQNNLSSYIDPHSDHAGYQIIQELKSRGFEVLLSIGEVEENLIGSNCGQYLMHHMLEKSPLPNSYSYNIEEFID